MKKKVAENVFPKDSFYNVTYAHSLVVSPVGCVVKAQSCAPWTALVLRETKKEFCLFFLDGIGMRGMEYY